jgi:hypothetical protein
MKSLRSYVPTPLRRAAAWLLPLPSRLSSPNVSDVRIHVVRDGVRLEVYWLSGKVGPGPGASMLVFGDEILRFDCFGARRRGHMHLNLKQSRGFPGGGAARLYYREHTIEEQIERSCFELDANLAYALKTNASSRIRRLRLRPDEVAGAVAFLRQNMLSLLQQYHSDPGSGSAGSPPVEETAREAIASVDKPGTR